jgi:hypothetical protein
VTNSITPPAFASPSFNVEWAFRHKLPAQQRGMMVVLFRKPVFSLNNNSHRGALTQAAVLKTRKKYGDSVERCCTANTVCERSGLFWCTKPTMFYILFPEWEGPVLPD